MKKVVALFLTLALALSLCACGKSELVKSVEAQIATLNENSTYAEIYEVFQLYKSAPDKDREKVENADVLAEYCDLTKGHFVLTDAMLEEIEEEFEISSLGVSSVEFAVIYDFSVIKSIYDWNNLGDIEIVSSEKDSDYSYTAYGNMKIQDKYGDVSSHKFSVEYYAEFDAEEECGYTISDDVNIH